jgi:hypothetical protein
MFEHFCNIYNFNNKCCSPHSVFPMTGLLLSQFGISEGPRFRKSCKKPQILGKCNRKSCKKPLLQEEYPSGPPLTSSFGFLSLSLSLSPVQGLAPHTQKSRRGKRHPTGGPEGPRASGRIVLGFSAKQFGKSRPIGFLQPTGHNTSRKEIPCVWHGPGRSPRVGRPA